MEPAITTSPCRPASRNALVSACGTSSTVFRAGAVSGKHALRAVLQIGDRKRPPGCGGGQQHLLEMRRQRRQHLLHPLVAAGPEDQHPPPVRPQGVQVLRESFGAARIVRGVEEETRPAPVAGQPFQPSRPADRRDAVPDPNRIEGSEPFPGEEPLRSPDGERQVVQLMPAGQGQPEVVVGRYGGRKGPGGAGPVDRAIQGRFLRHVPEAGRRDPGRKPRGPRRPRGPAGRSATHRRAAPPPPSRRRFRRTVRPR